MSWFLLGALALSHLGVYLLGRQQFKAGWIHGYAQCLSDNPRGFNPSKKGDLS